MADEIKATKKDRWGEAWEKREADTKKGAARRKNLWGEARTLLHWSPCANGVLWVNPDIIIWITVYMIFALYFYFILLFEDSKSYFCSLISLFSYIKLPGVPCCFVREKVTWDVLHLRLPPFCNWFNIVFFCKLQKGGYFCVCVCIVACVYTCLSPFLSKADWLTERSLLCLCDWRDWQNTSSTN